MANPELKGRLTLSDETKAALASMEEGVKKATLASSEQFKALDAQVKGLSGSLTQVGSTGLDPAKFKAFGESLAGLSGGQASQFIGSLDQVEQRIAKTALTAAQAAPKVAEFHGSLSTLSSKAKEVGAGLDDAGQKVGGFISNLTKVGEAGAKAATSDSGIGGFVTQLGAMGGSIPLVGALIAGLTAALGGLLGFLEHIVNEEAAFAFAIENQNALLGINTDTLQALDTMVGKLGGSQDEVTNGLRRFQTQVDSGASGLSKYHLTLQQIGITHGTTDQQLAELNTYLAGSASQMDKNAASTVLLGKGNTTLQEALSGTIGTIDEQVAALKQSGNYMDAATLAAGASAKVTRDGLGEALHGLEVQLAGPLFSGMTQFFSLLTSGAEGAQGTFHGLGEAINTVITDVVDFIAGLTGVTLNTGAAFTTMRQNAVDAATAAQKQAQGNYDTALAAQNAKDAIDALKVSTQDQTRAIDAQIKVIQDNQSAFDANIQAQISDQQALVTALGQQYQMQDLLQQQADENGTSALAKLKAQLAAVRGTYDNQRKAGESEADYEKRITEQGLQAQITTEEAKRTATKTTQDIAKAQLQDQTTQVIAQLTARKTAYDGDTKAQLDALNAQKANLQQHLQDAQNAQTAAQDTSKTDLRNYNDSLTSANADLQKAIALKPTDFPNTLNQAFIDAGAKVRSTIQGWIDHPETILPDLSSLGDKAGQELGGGIMSGLYHAATSTYSNEPWWKQTISTLTLGVVGFSPDQPSNPPSKPPGKQFGGGVLSGIDYVVGEKGPERFRAPADGHITPAGSAPSSGGNTYNFTINGAPQMSPDELMREASWHMKTAV